VPAGSYLHAGAVRMVLSTLRDDAASHFVRRSGFLLFASLIDPRTDTPPLRSGASAGKLTKEA